MNDAETCEARVRERMAREFGPIIAWDVINEPMIRQFLEAFGYGERPGPEGLITGPRVPAAMLQVWTMAGYTGRHAPGSADRDAWDVLELLGEYGFTKAIGVSSSQQYDRQPLVGDRLMYTSHLHAMSGLKRTAVGDGYFVTVRCKFANQLGLSIGSIEFTMLVVRPAVQDVTSPLKQQSENGGVGLTREINGQPFPELRVPVSVTSIIATAIATRDFHPVHHSQDFARASGSPDIFMNILSINGYVERFVWESFGRSVHSIAVKLALPIYPGDELSFSGKPRPSDEARDGPFDINVVADSRRGRHVEATLRVCGQ
ncbi:MaoC dehydratase-like protein [Paraburkholderia sp. BL18I3N2]|uniref:MaoC/PaaZ C-terminal domain-containing protein n=1 Tax=Paraburkholderia sp. BL18I3N2 TaxID=1938799 RepID=UPI000D064F2C|nr:MaoC/PaaZ C-terminal domain-containing protein [Paraburkholderia sp. BL18I3N2]PRX27393.1 MaoC dehydratase-like protein [Paraburkholderia sp. BL18I3N2]